MDGMGCSVTGPGVLGVRIFGGPMKWLYEHVFRVRGIGWLFLAGVATIVALSLNSGCSRTNREQDAREKEATAKILKRMHGDASEQMRKYNESQLQKREELK